ncbi:hypothetical protein [Sphingomonas abietis]|uniref:Anti-sigma factor NepR domain-containing protein n=1 Tax=Sphingomonas abietis TaxID=3012344 RepID=A0ABY7NQ20_9SPHN|nr:hypothetical protein [Sphingomonas abietis]WBO22708.1 hypothetical protein PBT88_00700 [Sphingomonas abietis]
MQKIHEQRVGAALKRAFAQPIGQQLPHEFIALLAALDRSKSEPVSGG